MLGIFGENLAKLSVHGETQKTTNSRFEVYFKGNFYLRQPALSEALEGIARTGVTPDAIAKLPGQFVIVVYDKKDNRLSFVRDHIGQQPLYYCQDNDQLLFASSIKELRMLSKRSWSVDIQGFYDYFALKYSVPNSTLIAEVSEQTPGTIVEFFGNRLREERPYIQKIPSTPIADQNGNGAWLDRFKAEFEKSVASVSFDADSRRIAVLSSGGIDSSVLVGAYRRLTKERFRTFYVGCEGYKNDKAKEAEYISQLYGTSHQSYLIDGKEFSRHLIRTIEVNDFPLNSPSAVLRNYLYSNISGEVDVLLSGGGADCLYAGYYVFDLVYRFYSRTRARQIYSALVRLLPLSMISGDRGRRLRTLRQAIICPPHEYFLNYDTVIVNNNERLHEMLEGYDDAVYLKEYKKVLTDYDKKDVLNKILSIYQSTYLSENLATLAKFDDAYGMQHRHPFISNPMKEAFNKISWDRKIGGFTRKRLILEIAQDYLPESYFKMPKEGFGIPIVEWFRESSSLGQYVDLINSRDFRERGHFRKSYIDRLLSDYQNDKMENDLYEGVLWPMINFELWNRSRVLPHFHGRLS